MNLEQLLALKNEKSRPRIVVHCGSTTKAKEEFEFYRLADTLDGYVVLTIGANKNDTELHITPEQAVMLDILHLHKIDMADFVRVLNPGGYIGESTAREIEYAHMVNKPVIYLE